MEGAKEVKFILSASFSLTTCSPKLTLDPSLSITNTSEVLTSVGKAPLMPVVPCIIKRSELILTSPHLTLSVVSKSEPLIKKPEFGLYISGILVV